MGPIVLGPVIQRYFMPGKLEKNLLALECKGVFFQGQGRKVEHRTSNIEL
jgi:hypothetical protein